MSLIMMVKRKSLYNRCGHIISLFVFINFIYFLVSSEKRNNSYHALRTRYKSWNHSLLSHCHFSNIQALLCTSWRHVAQNISHEINEQKTCKYKKKLRWRPCIRKDGKWSQTAGMFMLIEAQLVHWTCII